MQKLTDAQLVILSAACQREYRSILPLPANLKGGAAQNVVASLLAKGLAEERPAQAGAPAWRDGEDGQRFALVATDAAFQALGIERENRADEYHQPATEACDGPQFAGADGRTDPEAQPNTAAKNAKIADRPEHATHKTRTGTKQAQLVAMLREPDGASLEEIVAATGWLPHTVRGAIAGALKKKLGLTVTSEKVERRGRVYRIASTY